VKNKLAHLYDALNAGHEFRGSLRETVSLPRTKWIDTLSHSAKPAILALTIAAGATGCSTMTHHDLLTGSTGAAPTQYSNLVSEAAALDSLPRTELAQIIRDRPQANQYSDLEQITVIELAKRFEAAAGQTAAVLQEPVVIDNPFQPGKQIRISHIGDWSANWDIGVKEAGSLAYAIKLSAPASAFAVNTNHFDAANNTPEKSLSDPSRQSYIVIGDSTSHTRGSVKNSHGNRIQGVTFSLFHELAHTTFAEELVLYGGANPASDNVAHAQSTTYRPLNEVHADLSAILANNKAFDWSPAELQQSIESLSMLSNVLTLGTGIDSIKHTKSTLDYPNAYANRVLLELLDRDPEILKTLSYEAIPLVAYDIVKKAGYFYNAADFINKETLTNISADMNSPSAMENDSHLISAILQSLPDSGASSQAARDLAGVWKHTHAISTFEKMGNTLEAFAHFDNPNIKTRDLRSFASAVQYIDGYPDAKATMFAVTERLQATTRSGLSDNQSLVIAGKLRGAVKELPSLSELSDTRAKLLDVIRQDIKSNLDHAAITNPSFKVAQGSGQSIQQIASDIQTIYGNPYWFDKTAVKTQSATLSDSTESLELMEYDHDDADTSPRM
jgi:hypothetical protein